MTDDLVSCVCITHDRVPLLRKAVACFLAQTHAARELVVLHEDRDTATSAFLAALSHPMVRSVVVPSQPRLTLGAKRNIAAGHCRGAWLAVWDDDDWHGPQRLAAQLQVIRASGQPACTLRQVLAWDASLRQAWLCEPRQWECTLLCHLDAMPPYADIDTGGDVPCVNTLAERQALAWADAPHLYIYHYHGRNVGTRAHFRRRVFAFAQALPPSLAARIEALVAEPSGAPLTLGEVRAATPPAPGSPVQPAR